MSKKKVSGNTMTLKDFHGGSIPSDLPLPSAPSLNMRPSDRSGYERTSSWGNRSRPHTLQPTKPFDEKTPFFTHSAHSIGRNFDEDERKPLDAVSAPRRTVTAHNSSTTTTTSAWSSPNAVSKLVHASALDKVMSSAATWQSNGPRVHVNGDDGALGGEKEHYSDAVLARHADRVLSIDDDQVSGGGRNEFVGSKYSDVRPRSVASVHHDADGVQVPRSFTKLGASELHHPMPSEVSERPKLKLLPRAKASESSEPSYPDHGQVHGQGNSAKPVFDGTGNGKEAGQRPKLNLKPRSQLLEHHLEGNTERERNALFGGARPRELVLKERGVDDVVINNLDVGVEHSNRTEHPTPRTKKLPDRYAEKNEGAPAPYDRWTGKKPERKEQRVEAERVNSQSQRRNWRSDNRRNVQEVDKQQVAERPPSPKTWRKPAEEPKSSAETGSMSHGKAASAVDLAQAFSRSVSDPRVNDRFSGQRGSNNGRTQVPFSRLVGPTPTPRPQINGY